MALLRLDAAGIGSARRYSCEHCMLGNVVRSVRRVCYGDEFCIDEWFRGRGILACDLYTYNSASLSSRIHHPTVEMMG